MAMSWREQGIESCETLIDQTVRQATPVFDSEDLRPMIAQMASAQIVMLGESSHGTHEFYETRRHITQELITNYGFRVVAVEGDWPPSWKVNEYIHTNDPRLPWEALSSFHRWPTWMWANAEVLELVQWLREFNAASYPEARAGFYGLDVYSLFESVDEVIRQLRKLDPFAASQVRARYDCFEPFEQNEKTYAKSLVAFPEGCQKEVLDNLTTLLRMKLDRVSEADYVFRDHLFDAQQNARIVAHAEDYYRSMILGSEDSWNVREKHMFETMETLLQRYRPDTKMIVWAHNTHIGDHRATDMVARGQVNIGGLARQKWGKNKVCLVGFGTNEGEVIASSSWGGPIRRLVIPSGRRGSVENAFHVAAEELATNAFHLNLNRCDHPIFNEVRGHRAIGVVYDPAHERFGNYVPTSLGNRYDHFIFFNETEALRPLATEVDKEEMPQTYPAGM